MSKLEWDKTGERFYETGTSHVVLYLQGSNGGYTQGVAWNGVTGITESPGGAETTDLWADDIKYATLRSAETFGATIEAYTYPDEFMQCDGSIEPLKGVILGQQGRNTFGLSYQTKIGNDTTSEIDDGVKLHLIYGASASPSQKGYKTVNNSPEAITFSWEMTTIPVNVDIPGIKPVSSITINSLKADPTAFNALLDILYGTADKEPRLPLPEEILELFEELPLGQPPEDGE